MRDTGLNYPVITWIGTRDFYEKKFSMHTPNSMMERLPDPVYVDSNRCILIKGGNNRYLAAMELGYEIIDCMIFDEQLDAIKWARYLDHCDPLQNPDKPFLGLMEYN
jgi:hypothetical protein